MQFNINNEKYGLIIVFRKVKKDDTYYYEFDSIGLKKGNVICNETFGSNYPISYLNEICSEEPVKNRQVIIEKPKLSQPFAYCRIQSYILTNVLKMTYKDAFEYLLSICKVFEKSAYKSLDEDSSKYAWIENAKGKDYKVDDIKMKYNIMYVVDEIRRLKTALADEEMINYKKQSLLNNKKPNFYDYDVEDPYLKTSSKSTNVQTNKTDLSFNINRIIEDIKGKIVGQDAAIESVVSNIYANQKIIATGNRDLISTQKASILIDGPTGTGKTAILKETADKLSLPIVVTNATAYSTTGYVGSSLTDILVKLLEKTKGNLELAQKGIVVIDEIDKLGKSEDSKIDMKKAVQQELLSYISGGKFDVQVGGTSYEFDTTNLTFISMGAFTELRDKKIAECKTKKSKPIGFTYSDVNDKKEDSEDKSYTITPQDYINSGLEREFVGRFSLLTSTKAYMVEDFKKILLESSISPLKSFIEFAKSMGVEDVTYDDEFIQMVSEKAYKDGFGARGLHQTMSDIKNSLLLDILNGNCKNIVLTSEILKKASERSRRSY